MPSSESSSSDEDDRLVPKSRRGWDGEDLELEHQRESLRQGKEKASAAVDITQFQNHEVGSGYQAKHVVRQRSTVKPAATNIKDMSKSNKSREKGTDMSKSKQEKRKRKDDENRLKKYLSSPGFLMFRQEIEDILSS